MYVGKLVPTCRTCELDNACQREVRWNEISQFEVCGRGGIIRSVYVYLEATKWVFEFGFLAYDVSKKTL